MAKKIRIGNDVHVTWTVKDSHGNAYDLEGRDLEVRLVCYGWKGVVTDLSVSGNVATFTFFGKDQVKAGTYGVQLVENSGGIPMVTRDVQNVFVLVHTSREAGGPAGTGIVPQTVTINR
jgi:hypothetical protein